MKLEFFGEYWPKFKQESIPILFLSISNVWLTFNFPTYLRLGSPFSSIACTMISAGSIMAYIVAFSSAHEFVSYVNLASFDESPYPPFFKNMIRISIITILLIGMFFIWSIDFHRMSNLNYIIFYLHLLASYALLYRAANRKP